MRGNWFPKWVINDVMGRESVWLCLCVFVCDMRGRLCGTCSKPYEHNDWSASLFKRTVYVCVCACCVWMCVLYTSKESESVRCEEGVMESIEPIWQVPTFNPPGKILMYTRVSVLVCCFSYEFQRFPRNRREIDSMYALILLMDDADPTDTITSVTKTEPTTPGMIQHIV